MDRPRSTIPLPIPTFLAAQAIPTAVPPARAARYASRTASSVFSSPTPGPRRCPDPNRSPVRQAFRQRISQPSRPIRSASRSRQPSMANVAWGTPKPRNAPAGGLFV